jgi:NAD(P)H-dependent FMN reductase
MILRCDNVKVLAINGSPHKGNTSEKLKDIKEKFEKYDEVEFETIDLRDMDIQPCRGCFTCFIKGEDFCPLKDDRELISKKIDKADGVIFASPVYSMHISYLLKSLIDRMAYTFHRPKYFGKYAVSIAVAGNIGLKETLEYLKMVETSWGFENIGDLGYIAAPKNTPIKINATTKNNVEDLINQFYGAIKEKKPRKLTLNDHITFRLMQTVYSRMEEMSPYDYQYWKEKGWFDKNIKFFFTNVKRNFLKDTIARILAWFIGRKMDKQFSS